MAYKFRQGKRYKGNMTSLTKLFGPDAKVLVRNFLKNLQSHIKKGDSSFGNHMSESINTVREYMDKKRG